MNRIRLSSEPAAQQEDRAFIEDAINNYNVRVTGVEDYHPLNIFLRGQDGMLLGGILGHCWGGWLHITTLWLAESVRGQGYGTQLVHAAEAEAQSHGCHHAYLETFSFQARPFYEALGYHVIGHLADYPPGHSHYILQKRLSV
jgi:GNAT superfamily N-acetyltransferase